MVDVAIQELENHYYNLKQKINTLQREQEELKDIINALKVNKALDQQLLKTLYVKLTQSSIFEGTTRIEMLFTLSNDNLAYFELYDDPDDPCKIYPVKSRGSLIVASAILQKLNNQIPGRKTVYGSDIEDYLTNNYEKNPKNIRKAKTELKDMLVEIINHYQLMAD